MAATSLGPPLHDPREIPHVVRDEDTLLLRRELQHVLVGQPSEILVLVQSKHVVPRRRKRSSNMPA